MRSSAGRGTSSSLRGVDDDTGDRHASLAPRPPRFDSTVDSTAGHVGDSVPSQVSGTARTDGFPTDIPWKTPREKQSDTLVGNVQGQIDMDEKIKAKAAREAVRTQHMTPWAVETPWKTTSEEVAFHTGHQESSKNYDAKINAKVAESGFEHSLGMFSSEAPPEDAFDESSVDLSKFSTQSMNQPQPGAVAVSGLEMDAALESPPDPLQEQHAAHPSNLTQSERGRHDAPDSITREQSEQLFNAVLVEEQEPPAQTELPYAEATMVPPEKPWWRTRPFYIGVCFLVLVVVVVVVAVVATRPGSSDSSATSSTTPPTSSPTLQPTLAPTLSRLSVLQSLVMGFSTDGTLPDEETPQGKALTWIINDVDSQVPLTDTDRLTTRYALAVFYFSTQGHPDGWFDKANFLSPDHECDWRTITSSVGVDCDSSQRVISLNIPDNRVAGVIPPEIGLLTSLSRLNLRGLITDGSTVYVQTNDLNGTLPEELGNLSRLIALDLSQNGHTLDGTLITEIAQMTSLVELRLNDCGFTGTIPEEIGNMPSLTFLSLSNNFLTGAVPETIDNLKCFLLDGNDNITCDWLRRRSVRRLQAFSNRETCSSYTPPCEL